MILFEAYCVLVSRTSVSEDKERGRNREDHTQSRERARAREKPGCVDAVHWPVPILGTWGRSEQFHNHTKSRIVRPPRFNLSRLSIMSRPSLFASRAPSQHDKAYKAAFALQAWLKQTPHHIHIHPQKNEACHFSYTFKYTHKKRFFPVTLFCIKTKIAEPNLSRQSATKPTFPTETTTRTMRQP